MGEGDGRHDRAGEVFWPGLSTWLGPLPIRNSSLSSQKSQILFLAVESVPAVNQAAQAGMALRAFPERRGNQGESEIQ